MTKAPDYNRKEFLDGRLGWDDVTECVKAFQRECGLEPDGKAGPATRAAIAALQFANADTLVDVSTVEFAIVDHWLTGFEVKRIPMHPSWRYAKLDYPEPRAIVWHYSDTAYGTAENMARRRVAQRGSGDRAASWHLSIEGDGRVIQMAPLNVGTWHAGSPTAKAIAGLGWANRVSVGIELIGAGENFPEPQIASACAVARALVDTYGIVRQYAGVGHSQLDPTRRKDPGPVWENTYLKRVLDYAYAP